jgi:hypothetical protein
MAKFDTYLLDSSYFLVKIISLCRMPPMRRLLLLAFLFIGSLSAVTKEDIPIIPVTGNRSDQRKSKVALCAIFKNEASFLKEWIEFHRLIGISHFYLYNNCSSDNYLDVLRPYILEGIIELFDVPFDSTIYLDFAKTHNFVQVCCYNHAIELSRGYNKWLAIIDTDEFICPVKHKDLPTLLKKYDYAVGLKVYWQTYGSSNVWDIGHRELMIEKLLHRFPTKSWANNQYKSIVKPAFVTCKSPHSCAPLGGREPVFPNHKVKKPGKNSSLPVDNIRINHYTYRTLSFYYNVKKARRVNWGFNPSPELEQNILNESNAVYDPIMLKFVPKLRERLFGS